MGDRVRGSTGLNSGRVTVTNAGTRVQLPAQQVASVIITAETDNTGAVVIGGSDVVAAIATRKGIPLLPGDSIELPVDDVSDIWIDAEVNTDGVTFLATI